MRSKVSFLSELDRTMGYSKLDVKRIILDGRKRVGSVERMFNEETEKHLLNVAPSADKTTEGAFLIFGKALKLAQNLSIVI